ncbi:hypothetical protein BT63DRAFT_79601 [Microthyrium microscopicum]|uniref:Cell wall protein n=1 Tax=Microthyrium microscopicum TaxID=703497 RepID=A0A6A6U0G5_9PEZI|nr:hypothetical protein BT63DRAFT_79601 [Microthyrium microscopicum]
MKFSVIIGLLGSVALTNAAALAPMDMTTMQVVFDHIFTGLDKLTEDTRSYTGGADGVKKIVSDANAVQATVMDGINKVKASKGMYIVDIATILGPVGVMESQVHEAVDIIKSKKKELQAANADKDILGLLTQLRSSAGGLVDVILAGLPLSSIVGLVARPIANTILTRIDEGIKEWGGTPGAAANPPVGSAPKATAAAAPKAAATPKASGTAAAPKGILGGLFGGKGSAAKASPTPPAAAAPPAVSPAAAPAPAGMAGMAGHDHGM